MPADCRIRKLHIRTPDKKLLPHIAFVFEDALRTASFPGIPPNGMVYIRCLDLGKTVASLSSRVLSQRLDDLLRHMRPVQVTENASDHLDAQAVWFADELEPYRLLTGLLAKNHRPEAWYWSSAVKGWRPNLAAKQSYQLIFSTLSQHPTGIRGLAHVLEPLFNRQNLLDVLSLFDPKEVSPWLFLPGLKPPFELRVPTDTEDKAHDCARLIKENNPLTVSRYGKDCIRKAVKMWSVSDSRTLFTAYLVLKNGGQLLSPIQVARLFDAALNQGNEERLPDSHKRSHPSPGQMKRVPVCSPVEAVRPARFHNKEAAGPLQTITNDRKESSGTEKQDAQKKLLVQAQRNGTGAYKERVKTAAGFQEPPWPEDCPLSGGFAGELSRFAGLWFVVQVIKRLGIETLLDNYPNYYELQFSERILWKIAEFLQIPSNDPALYFLGEKPGPSIHQIEFAAPANWGSILLPQTPKNRFFRLCRVTGMPGKRLILDYKGRLIIGLWSPHNRKQLDPWLDGLQTPLKQMAPRIWSLEIAVHNFVIALCRYVRRYADMSLRSLVHRPATIASTRTHLDVTIPFDQLDIRIRMAGLDINPGWVPWLGHVIQFHYVGGES